LDWFIFDDQTHYCVLNLVVILHDYRQLFYAMLPALLMTALSPLYSWFFFCGLVKSTKQVA
jgi:hypothetical protein